MSKKEVPTDIYNFATLDYAIVIVVLFLTAFIGMYHVFKAKNAKNTREFLVANTGMGILPLVLSMVATVLSPGTLLGIPMEGYSNGVQMIMLSVGYVLSKAFSSFTIMPVLYNANINTINQYVEYRFNRFLRTVPAFVFIIQSSVFLAAINYITAVVLSQATGLHIWSSILILTVLCVVYSSLGGVTAVIWTDVLQTIVIFGTYITFFIVAINSMGGIGEIWEKNYYGKRTTFAYLKPDSNSNYTIWSLVIGYFFIGLAFAASSQSELQRALANRKLSSAQTMSIGTSFIVSPISLLGVFIGMISYARHYKCDPVLNGEMKSRDQISPIFAMELFHDTPGLSGLYVSGILCATLSTLSSIINAVSTITLIDFIKPIIPNASDATTKIMSKVIGCVYGLFLILLTGVTQYFGGLVQTFQAVVGISIGPTAGILLLGIFFPWATAKGATTAYVVSLTFGWWLCIGRVMSGARYVTAPMTTVNCNTTISFNSSFVHGVNQTSTTPTNDPFFMFTIIPLWYCVITIIVVFVVGMTVSILTGSEDMEKLNPKYISPLTKWIGRQLPKLIQKKTGLKSLLENDEKVDKAVAEGNGMDQGHELNSMDEKQSLKPSSMENVPKITS